MSEILILSKYSVQSRTIIIPYYLKVFFPIFHEIIFTKITPKDEIIFLNLHLSLYEIKCSMGNCHIIYHYSTVLAIIAKCGVPIRNTICCIKHCWGFHEQNSTVNIAMHIIGQLDEGSLLVMIRLIEVDFVIEQSGYTTIHHWRAGCRYRRVPISGKLFYGTH